MEILVEWILIVIIIFFYSFVLGCLLTWKRFRTLVIGYGKHRRGQDDEPVVLPYFVAAWAALTMGGLAWARTYYETDTSVASVAVELSPPMPPPSSPPPYNVKIPGSLGSSAHAFFAIGWRTGLAIFGITVETWGLYTAVCIYQLTRAVLGSMVNNIFVPFYNDTVNCKSSVSRRTERRALVGLALCRVFTWWSSLTDILISASQLDLALFTLLATVCADVGYGFMRIRDEDTAPIPVQTPPAPAVCVSRPPPTPQPQAPPMIQSYGQIATTRRRSRSPVNKQYGTVMFVMDQRVCSQT